MLRFERKRWSASLIASVAPRRRLIVAAVHLAQVPDGALGEPSLVNLGLKLGRMDELANLARSSDDPIRFAAIRLEVARRSS